MLINELVKILTMNPITEYIEIVDRVYGLFLDATYAFPTHRKKFIENQQAGSKLSKLSIEELDALPLVYGIGPSANCIELHTTTQGDLKKRNEKNGRNTKTIGNLCLCEIYHYWEDHYRKEIAEYLGLSKNKLLSDIFGDIRNYRRSIIHNRGVAISHVNNHKLLKWFRENDLIEVDENKMQHIIHQIYQYLNQIKK